jgi:multiple sugar transport system permease protein
MLVPSMRGGSRERMAETGGSELARPALIAPASPGAAWRRRGIVLDRYFTRVAILPTFVVMLGVFGMPLAFSFYLSFTGYAQGQGLFSGGYVGLENYQDLLSDPVFTGSITITLVYTAAAVAAEMVLGLGIALLLNIDLPGIRICRTALIIPMMVTPIVGALCWKLLLDPSHGVINHWIGQHIVWLGRPDTALAAIWIVGVWQSTPYVMLILLAGLRSLPGEPTEAAAIDGASRWQVFWHITLPLLRPYLLVGLRTVRTQMALPRPEFPREPDGQGGGTRPGRRRLKRGPAVAAATEPRRRSRQGLSRRPPVGRRRSETRRGGRCNSGRGRIGIGEQIVFP